MAHVDDINTQISQAQEALNALIAQLTKNLGAGYTLVAQGQSLIFTNQNVDPVVSITFDHVVGNSLLNALNFFLGD